MKDAQRYSQPWKPDDPQVPGRQNLVSISDEAFTAGRFKGRTVIVTGCARGMGRAAAVRLAREGANVFGVDWLAEPGRALAAELTQAGLSMRFMHGDVGHDDVCAQMVREAVAAFGGLDAAINNAGVMDGIHSGEPVDYAKQKADIFAPIHEASDAYWNAVMRTNADGVFYSMRHELRQMMKQARGGAIVNVGSIAGLTGLSGNPAYVASKHAVSGLTKNAAIDYAPYGIRVNSVNMAATDTPMVARAGQLVEAQMRAKPSTGMGTLKTKSLLAFSDQGGRSATVAEQVAVMLFMLSNEASNLTGATFATDGGWTTN